MLEQLKNLIPPFLVTPIGMAILLSIYAFLGGREYDRRHKNQQKTSTHVK